LLLLSLIVLQYVDNAQLSPALKRVVRTAVPAAALLLPTAFFLSVLSPDATEPNGFIYLAYAGALLLAAGLLILGLGLVRKPRAPSHVRR
jgi:high-affinity Fe2+/Pb2+ permease